MTLDPINEARVETAVRDVAQAAEDARKVTDLAAMKTALNRVWFAVHDAQKAINDAEAQTRKAALERVRAFA